MQFIIYKRKRRGEQDVLDAHRLDVALKTDVELCKRGHPVIRKINQMPALYVQALLKGRNVNGALI